MKTYWKPQHEVFVRGMLAHGDRIRAYREAYPNIFPTAVRQAAVRLMNHPEIRQHLEPVFEQAKAAAMQQLEQMAGQRIAGRADIRMVAEGEGAHFVRLVDQLDPELGRGVACVAVVVMISSYSMGVNRPSAACRRRR